MTTTPISTDTEASVDVFLGPAEKRFFGRGYRRVRYQLGVPAFAAHDGAEAIQFRASILCPTDWSAKADGDQRPHLSTIDALVLGQWAAETAALMILGLTPEAVEACTVESVTIYAGKTPIEDLANVDVIAIAVHSDDYSSTWKVTVGNMRLSYRLRQHAPRPGGPCARGAGGPGELTDVAVDASTRSSRATLTAGTPADLLPESRLGRSLADGPSLIDAFVATLQLGQVLLYELDSMSRAQSNTLWMRQTTLTTDAAQAHIATESHDVAVHLDRVQRLELGGSPWRTADVVGAVAGMTVRCAVAHQLPSR